MLNPKQRFYHKSFRFKIGLVLVLALFAIGLYYLVKHFTGSFDSDNLTHTINNQRPSEFSTFRISYEELRSKTDRDIDSIFYNFGIKKEWITTAYPEDKPQKQKKETPKVLWFVKNVLIPKEVSSAQINLDLTSYLNYLGLRDSVYEDIKTTDLVMNLTSPEDTSSSQSGIPLAKIIINHSEKVVRESCTFVIVLNISRYRHDTNVDYLLTNSNEFSYLFPRNPDEIEFQNKLIQLKKDVILNLFIGKNDNIDADFNTGMDDKEIKQKARSIILDFPNIRTYYLTRIDSSLQLGTIYSSIGTEFQKYSGSIIPDSSITRLLLKSEEDSKSKLDLIIERLKSKIGTTSKVITFLTIPNDELLNFYDEVMNLKKLGCKFYTYNQYTDKLKQDQIKSTNKISQNQPADLPDKSKNNNPVQKEKDRHPPSKKTKK